MKHAIITLAITMACGAGTALAADTAMSRQDHKAQKERNEADYKSARQQCEGMKGNARDVCVAQAKGKHEVVKAQLEARRDPGAKREAQVRRKQAEADYRVAREKCDDLRHGAKDACREDAKATYEHAKDQARIVRADNESRPASGAPPAEPRQVRGTAADSEYAAAKERCETLASLARDNCMNEVRKRFSRM